MHRKDKAVKDLLLSGIGLLLVVQKVSILPEYKIPKRQKKLKSAFSSVIALVPQGRRLSRLKKKIWM